MLSVTIEKILVYAEERLTLSPEDVHYYRNVLLNKFNVAAPYRGAINISEIKSQTSPDLLIEELRAGLSAAGFSKDKHDVLINDVLGMLTPIPSVINNAFAAKYKEDAANATDYLYNLGVANNYIKTKQVNNNIVWHRPIDNHELVLTINLAKPEKDNKQIAKVLQTSDEDKYPSCHLCLDNVGYAGNAYTDARHTLRAVPVKLDEETWYLQYSPYVYFDRHAIVISEEHKPMTITPRVLSKLLSFVDKFPHFFVGSNADLPIVGGSILNHEHFQGGAKVMPMFNAADKYVVKHKAMSKIKISILDWYSSVIKLEASSKKTLLETASKITEKWLSYNNEALNIISATNGTRHNTITPIAVKEKRKYIMYIILRNNRTNEAFPEGIFHVHPQYHGIKKEGIGLIEQMGTFILPARLKRQFAEISALLSAKTPTAEVLKHSDLRELQHLIETLSASETDDYDEAIKTYVTKVCKEILVNTAVFKKDEAGEKAFINFLS